ncbi:hypothetical protein RIR_jg14892.t1 [Rhizophagus irregularis DAOM 181602=DAOM 197198]|nr:hypothetical protein RIR_jg14892.t1 [Rhizophagus irregularis DAOM 181602=DAOM 197198]
MDVPPLMDWQHITEQITIILEEIAHLTTEFAQLQHCVKCSPASPPNGSNFTAQSHIPLPSRMSLIPDPATLPQDCLSSLTATVTELTKTVKQGMAQQQQFLAARDNANSQ